LKIRHAWFSIDFFTLLQWGEHNKCTVINLLQYIPDLDLDCRPPLRWYLLVSRVDGIKQLLPSVIWWKHLCLVISWHCLKVWWQVEHSITLLLLPAVCLQCTRTCTLHTHTHTHTHACTYTHTHAHAHAHYTHIHYITIHRYIYYCDTFFERNSMLNFLNNNCCYCCVWWCLYSSSDSQITARNNSILDFNNMLFTHTSSLKTIQYLDSI